MFKSSPSSDFNHPEACGAWPYFQLCTMSCIPMMKGRQVSSQDEGLIKFIVYTTMAKSADNIDTIGCYAVVI